MKLVYQPVFGRIGTVARQGSIESIRTVSRCHTVNAYPVQCGKRVCHDFLQRSKHTVHLVAVITQREVDVVTVYHELQQSFSSAFHNLGTDNKLWLNPVQLKRFLRFYQRRDIVDVSNIYGIGNTTLTTSVGRKYGHNASAVNIGRHGYPFGIGYIVLLAVVYLACDICQCINIAVEKYTAVHFLTIDRSIEHHRSVFCQHRVFLQQLRNNNEAGATCKGLCRNVNIHIHTHSRHAVGSKRTHRCYRNFLTHTR